jgi:site-specific DNA recombinase
MTRKAVGYARVSTDMQDVSVEAQLDKISLYCQLNDLDLIDTAVDTDVSGGIPVTQRPGGASLIEQLALHRRDGVDVVVLKLDRLFRDAADALNTVRSWDKDDIGLHLIDHGGQTINTKSATGRMFLTMMAGFAEFERGLISERTAAALQHRKKNRRVYSSPPLGFEADDWGNLVEHIDEQKLVFTVKRLRKRGMSFRLIADKLNADGYVGKKGGKFYACTVRDICRNDIPEDRPHD